MVTDISARHRVSRDREDAEDLFFSTALDSQNISADFKRETFHGQSYSKLIDFHGSCGAKIVYLRVPSIGRPSSVTVYSRGNVDRVAHSNHVGSLLRVVHAGTQYTIWLPGLAEQFFSENHGRIKVSNGSDLTYEWVAYPNFAVTVCQRAEPGKVSVLPYVMIDDPEGEFFQELSSLGDLETRLYRKSDWFHASTPADIWKYLINGSLYDPRSINGIDWRFKCQQCAFAWWSYFDFLHAETGKRVYTLLRDEVAYSVLLDLSPQGDWGHGFWSDDIETHARFHLDGLHLLVSQYEKTGRAIWLEAAERGMFFVFENLMDKLDDGSPWFLHDTLELQSKHHLRSTLFGKDPGNSLCINTHVQALTVLHRLARLAPDKAVFGEKFDKGLISLRRVLDHQPARLPYRFLMSMLESYYAKLGMNDTVPARLKNALKWRMIATMYWSLRRVFPRIAHSNGFIDRDLTLGVASDMYHNTNLKDLLTLYQQEPAPWLRSYIVEGFKFEKTLMQALSFKRALERSPYYIEFVDILCLYDKLIARIPPEESDSANESLRKSTGGYSLDYYASGLVRPALHSA